MFDNERFIVEIQLETALHWPFLSLMGEPIGCVFFSMRLDVYASCITRRLNTQPPSRLMFPLYVKNKNVKVDQYTKHVAYSINLITMSSSLKN
jgi:hypothetical protein